MNVDEKLLESHKSVSRNIVVVLTVIFPLSIYVAQRALAVLELSPDLIATLTRTDAHQLNLLGLGFSYRTMTVLWPGVLGCLCLVFVILESKRRLIEHTLITMHAGMRGTDLVELDPFHVSARLFQSRTTRRTAELLALLPMIAIAAHISMLSTFAIALGWNAAIDPLVLERINQRFDELWSFVRSHSVSGAWFSLATTLFSVIGFLGALSFWRTVRTNLRSQESSPQFPTLPSNQNTPASPIPPRSSSDASGDA